MANRTVRAGDVTGKERERLAAEQAEKQREAAKQMSMATAVQSEVDQNAVFDSVTGHVIANTEDDLVIEVETEQPKMVVIRVNEDLEMTFGVGNNYNFEAGKKYTVSPDLAAHLDSKGYVWH